MRRKAKDPTIDPAVQAAEKTSRRNLIAVIVAAGITAFGAIGVAFINGWIGSVKSNATPSLGIYRVRVTVIDPQNVPVEDAKVWSSFGGESKKVLGGWQFDIPAASRPQDRQLSIFALRESDSLTGQTDIVLGSDYNPAVTMRLKHDDSAKVRGQVVDSKDRSIAGAKVFVVGYEANVVITKEGGNFELPAHAAVGQMVSLHAEKSGYDAVTQSHPAGNHPAKLVLEKMP
jgi:hypothetical protein